MSRLSCSLLSLVPVLVLSGACSGGTAPATPATEMPTATTEVAVPVASPDSTHPVELFSTEAFADISEDAVTDEAATEFQALLDEMARGAGMAATVMSPDGTWSGAAGSADGVRAVQVDDQFGIASITKTVVAAQVMQLVEAGELALDDLAAEYLPADLDFDTNGATIRQLLNHHSGIPDWYDVLIDNVAADPRRVWQPAEVLTAAGDDREPAGDAFEYADTNYNLLGLIIEHVRGRPLVDVLRGGVLSIAGIPRLVYQPAEAPSQPIAMPYGEPATALADRGGYLPSLADASSAGPAGAIASDSLSLAHWWRALCAGEIVTQASLTEMTTYHDEYGLGLFDVADPYAPGVGHTGGNLGYASWAGCLSDGSVVVVLTNREIDDIGGMARPLVLAARSD